MKKLLSACRFRLAIAVVSAVMVTFLFAGCASSGTGNSALLKTDPSVVSGTMDNGMSYYVQKNPKPVNRISLRLVVNAGSAMEEDDQRGLAHLIEHMAFNGTEHFEKNGIIKFFEQIGMNFGADLNAYTSFEETVYMLEIPADNPEFLDTAMLILRDWACGVTFPEDELAKERGVVREEWRLSTQGLNARISDYMLKQVLKGSRFAERLPIGDIDTVMNQKRQRLIDFYSDWYRPELMSVVVVGDIDAVRAVNAIKNTMGSIPASEHPVKKPVYDVPESFAQKNVATMRDPEQAYTLTQIMSVDASHQPIRTEAQYRTFIAENAAYSIANQRLMAVTMQPECPWIGANYLYFQLTSNSFLGAMAFIPKDGRYQDSLKLMLDEYDRMILFGVTQAELDETKLSLLTQAQTSYADSENIQSSDRASSIVQQIVNGDTALSDSDRFRLSKKFISALTVDEVNEALRTAFPDRGSICMSIVPSSDRSFPADSEIRNIWTSYRSQELAAYEDSANEGRLMPAPAKKAAVVSKTQIKELGATEYVFENGVTVYLKKTSYEKNRINFRGYSRGGSYVYDSADFPSLNAAVNARMLSGMGNMDFSQLQKYLQSRDVSFDLDVENSCEYIQAESAKADAETVFQLIYDVFENPHFTDSGWSFFMNNVETEAKMYNLEPMDAFSNKVSELMFADRFRYQSVSPEFVSKIDRSRGEMLFKQRFSNAADWAFVITGDFDEKKILDWCASYLGAIKGDPSKTEKASEPDYTFPAKVRSANVVKGSDAQGAAFIGFMRPEEMPDDLYERWRQEEEFASLGVLLDIRLREVIREDKSGAYGVSVNGDIDGDENRYAMMLVAFSCDPDRSGELIKEALECIADIQTNPVDESYITTLRETYLRNKESNLRTNDYWSWRIINGAYLKSEPLGIVQDTSSVPSWITQESLMNAARTYLPLDRYTTVTLRPEK